MVSWTNGWQRRRVPLIARPPAVPGETPGMVKHRTTGCGSEARRLDTSLSAVIDSLSSDSYWSSVLADCRGTCAIHLGVFVEPFLTYLLDGQKTIESRFSAVRCPPYNRVAKGDVLLVKRSGGPVVGVCEVGETWSYLLDPKSWLTIRRDFKDAMCAQDPEFWRSKSGATYATLMQVCNVRAIDPVPWAKRDRRGWVIVQPRLPN